MKKLVVIFFVLPAVFILSTLIFLSTAHQAFASCNYGVCPAAGSTFTHVWGDTNVYHPYGYSWCLYGILYDYDTSTLVSDTNPGPGTCTTNDDATQIDMTMPSANSWESTHPNDLYYVKWLNGDGTAFYQSYPFKIKSLSALEPTYSLNDQTINDNDNNLTNYGTTSVSTSLPYSGDIYATQFQSSNSNKLTAADSTSLHVSSAFTVEGWFKFNSTPSSGNKMGLIVKDDEQTQRAYDFWLANNGGTLRLEAVALGNSTDNYYYLNWIPTTGTWYHLALTFDGSQANGSKFTFYVNGVSQGHGTQIDGGNVTSINTATSVQTIGAAETNVNTFASYFDGQADDIRIWNVARSATDISDNMNTGLIGSETGLVAYYPFEQTDFNLNDITGNANNLNNNGSGDQVTAVSTASATLPFSVDNTRAALFEAAESDYLTAASSSSLNVTGPLTIESWVKFNSLPTTSGVTQGEVLVSKWYDNPNNRQYLLMLWNDGGTYKLWFAYSTDGTWQPANNVTTTWTPSTGIWYHVAVVLDTSVPNIKFYINGSQQGSTITSNTGTSIHSDADALWLGGQHSTLGYTYYLDGLLDDVRIWNIARSGSDISNDMNTDLIGSESGLVAYYPFE